MCDGKIVPIRMHENDKRGSEEAKGRAGERGGGGGGRRPGRSCSAHLQGLGLGQIEALDDYPRVQTLSNVSGDGVMAEGERNAQHGDQMGSEATKQVHQEPQLREGGTSSLQAPGDNSPAQTTFSNQKHRRLALVLRRMAALRVRPNKNSP